MPEPKRPGRPSTGTALTPAQRQARYRARIRANTVYQPTQGNPAHQRLFTIPAPIMSTITALTVRDLPEQVRVTGDLEVDAVLWLGQVCKTATDPATVRTALESAKAIQTPARELEDRYASWLARQPGAHPFAVALGSFGIADIEKHATRALERIECQQEGMGPPSGPSRSPWPVQRPRRCCSRPLAT